MGNTRLLGSMDGHMIKGVSTSCQSKVFAVAMVVGLIGLPFAHSSQAQAVILDELGSVPPVSLSTSSMYIGIKAAGMRSVQPTITLKNSRTAPLVVTNFMISGRHQADFTPTQNCPGAVATGEVCKVSRTIPPVAPRPRKPAIFITSNKKGSMQSIGPAGMGLTATGTGPGQFMALSADKTHLVNTITNKPMFITGEDAFDLAVQLSSNSDIDAYLSDRASRGFNLIWVALADNAYHDSAGNQNNALGQNPWGGNADFTNEDPGYWAHVDYVIQRAGAYGITVLAGPVFAGAYRGCAESGGYCPDIKRASDALMTGYGVFLGSRYKSYPNIVWLIGGDANISREGRALYNKLNDLALGIKSADTHHLMVVEAGNNKSGGEPSWKYFGGASWLDVNTIYLTCSCRKFKGHMKQVMLQSSSGFSGGHAPFFVVEDWYEGKHGSTPLGLRQEAYQAVLNGAYAGGLFGNNTILSFSAPCCATTGQTWQSQLNSPGTLGREYLGRLMRSREHWKMVPDLSHAVVTAGYGSGSTLATTSRTSDGQTIIAYIPNGSRTTLTVDMSKITSVSNQAKCWWFDPRDGLSTLIGTCANTGSHDFTPPDANDWVLVIDAADSILAAPGSADL
jgi:hypothetical protein